jgi:NodT family efflux transporter outer membrane factor (OMF) lipoprotein
MTKPLRPALLLGATLALGACSLAPAYHRPDNAPPAAQFKADPGWVPAAPADDAPKGPWWTLFGDPALDALEAKVAVTNQNVAAARAALAQARALLRADVAALLPVAGVSGSTTGTRTLVAGSPTTRSWTAGASASWVPDLWGRLANTARAAKAQAQASEATLANATLTAQASLASAYFQLRGLDAQAVLLDETLAGYERSLTVSRNKFAAGLVSAADVESASATLANARAARRDLARQRAALENAIAVLVGANPSTFTLAAAPWQPNVPEVPAVLPASLVQRRPDVAAAERAVAAANAQIGVQRAAFFPDLTLTSTLGSTAGTSAALFGAANSLWSLGASSALTVIDFGARRARVAQARAGYDGAVASYRQAVLTAFQEVENTLAANSAYRAEAGDYQRSAEAAIRAETIVRNQYVAGSADYTAVASAQAQAYNARTAAIQNMVNRQSTAVSLIEAIGGHW